MTDAFSQLSTSDLRALIAGLRSRRIAAPYSPMRVSRLVAPGMTQPVAARLTELELLRFTPEQIAAALELVESDRNARQAADTQIDLVTTGPEAPGVTNRDTAVVVRELFAHARASVLVVGYAIYQGQQVFEALARRMEEVPELHVQFFVNIARPDRDTTASGVLISRFCHRFKDSQWPRGCRLPEVFYDPRSIADEQPVRSSLHAKCIVVDRERIFVSSANFTDAGQARNIEVGLSIQSKWLAERLIRHFLLLREHGLAAQAM